MSERPRTRWASSVASIVSLLPPPLLGERGSLASNSKIPSATTSVGLDDSGPAECGGHLRAIQRYHPRPLRSVWTKVVRPSVGVTCEQFKDTIRDHFGRSGRKWSGRVWGSLASNSKIPSATTSVGLDESGPAECGGHLRAIQRYHPRPLRSVWTKVVRPSVGVTCEQFKDTIRDHFGRSGRKWSGRVWVTSLLWSTGVLPGDSAIRWMGWSRVFKPFYRHGVIPGDFSKPTVRPLNQSITVI